MSDESLRLERRGHVALECDQAIDDLRSDSVRVPQGCAEDFLDVDLDRLVAAEEHFQQVRAADDPDQPAVLIHHRQALEVALAAGYWLGGLIALGMLAVVSHRIL